MWWNLLSLQFCSLHNEAQSIQYFVLLWWCPCYSVMGYCRNLQQTKLAVFSGIFSVMQHSMPQKWQHFRLVIISFSTTSFGRCVDFSFVVQNILHVAGAFFGFCLFMLIVNSVLLVYHRCICWHYYYCHYYCKICIAHKFELKVRGTGVMSRMTWLAREGVLRLYLKDRIDFSTDVQIAFTVIALCRLCAVSRGLLPASFRMCWTRLERRRCEQHWRSLWHVYSKPSLRWYLESWRPTCAIHAFILTRYSFISKPL